MSYTGSAPDHIDERLVYSPVRAKRATPAGVCSFNPGGLEVIADAFQSRGHIRVNSQSARSASPQRHVYPPWFDETRRHFASQFDVQAISHMGGEVLRQPILDAIGIGRRIRPTLFCAFWAAETGRPPGPAELSLATAIELFHAASIIVDDLADKEIARRDKLPLFRKHGEELALLSSHALVACGYTQLSNTSQPSAIINLWNAAYLEACLGQSLDYRLDERKTLQHQQELSLKKTEAFFGFIGATLDVLLGRNVFETSLRTMGRVFQIGNDVLDLLCMDTSPRMTRDGRYPLRLSFLVPQLVDMGLIGRDEVFATRRGERLHEIARNAQTKLPSAHEILQHEIQSAILQINALRLNRTQAEFCEIFINQCCTESFWNHEHETFA